MGFLWRLTYAGCGPHRTGLRLSRFFAPVRRFATRALAKLGFAHLDYKKFLRGLEPMIDIGRRTLPLGCDFSIYGVLLIWIL